MASSVVTGCDNAGAPTEIERQEEHVAQSEQALGSCRTAVLSASKTIAFPPPQGTPSYADGHAAFSPPIKVAVPAEIPVTAGNSGHGRVVLTLGTAAGPIACVYEGYKPLPHHPEKETPANPGNKYVYLSCDDGAAPGALRTAASLHLHVQSSSFNAGTTTVGVTLVEQQPCGGGFDCSTAIVDDGNACTTDSCTSCGGVTHTPVAAGTSCTDGNACNGSEICNASGVCVAGTPPALDDGNPCTTDACTAAGGVTHAPVAAGTSCADSDPCNGSETCSAAGICSAGTPPALDDNNPCTTDACTASGGVTHTPVPMGTSCADSDACNGSETCSAAGVCSAGTPPALDDGNPCTTDACTASGGVTHAPVAMGTSCADGDACNGNETCNGAGACTGGTPPTVDDGNVCTTDTCTASGGVTHTPVAAGTSCSDGDACNGAETCNAAGVCAAGAPPTVDDGNVCTVDACTASAGVTHTPVAGAACGAATACGGAGTCDASGACVAGTPTPVDDGNPCTADACDPSTGAITHVPTPGATCSDGNACHATGTCFARSGFAVCLVGGPPPPVDDGNPCTADTCDPALGVIHTPTPGVDCGPNVDPCAPGDRCDASGACAADSPPLLDDGDPCTVDACDTEAGVTHTPPDDLDDGNPCTLDACDAAGAVTHTITAGASCADGDACNGEETCDAVGTCLAGSPPVADDGNPCTVDACNPFSGITHTPRPLGASCSDGDACNGSETCSALGACVQGPAPTLDDGNVCTVDACDPVLGVSHVPVPVDDGDPCTHDVCTPGLGVTHAVAVGAPCGTNADACSGGDTCDATGACVLAPAPGVDDGDLSTIDYCDPATGVHHVPAPPLDPTVTTTVLDSLSFLYSGPDAIQVGVAPGAFALERAAGVSGHVTLSDGSPAELAAVRVVGHPEYGATIVDAHGDFMMVVNGGGVLTFDIQRPGYLPVQRAARPEWNTYASIDDAILIPYDAAGTWTDFNPTTDLQVAKGTVETDNIGTRQATLLIPPGTTAMVEMPDGSLTPLAGGTVRLTEYTVGANGPEKMPAALPRSSGYTYAIALTVDEAEAMGAAHVRFDRPVAFYVDNFYRFAVGEFIPHGVYNRARGVWEGERDGVVVQIVGITAGRADLDTNGDGIGDTDSDLEAMGVTADERDALADQYTAGTTLWRVPIDHFSTEDCNKPSYPEEPNCKPMECDAVPDKIKVDDPKPKPCQDKGSRIECQNGIVGEQIPLPGTGMSLRYTTERTPGYVAARKISVPFSESVVPPTMQRISVTLQIAGQVFEQVETCPCAPDQRFELTWDGNDRYGRPVQGEQPVGVTWSYFYRRIMGSSPSGAGYSFGAGSGGISAAFINSSSPTSPNGYWDFQVSSRAWLGTQDARNYGLGGWELSPVTAYEPLSRTLVRGDGSREADASLRVGSPGAYAIHHAVSGASGAFTVLPDGAIVYQAADNPGIQPVYRRAPDGTTSQLTQAAANCSFTVDGGPALSACVAAESFAHSPDGATVYLADSATRGIRRIDPDGNIRSVTKLIETVGVDGEGCPDGAVARDTMVTASQLQASDDGSLYFVTSMLDNIGLHKEIVCRIGPEGRLSLIAGGGNIGSSDTNLTPAWNRRFQSISAFTVDHAGNAYIAEGAGSVGSFLWRVTPDGLAERVAGGGGSADRSLDDVDPLSTLLVDVTAMAAGGDGTVYFLATGQAWGETVNVPGVRALRSDGRIYSVAGHSQGGASAVDLPADGSVAAGAGLPQPRGLGVGPDGTVYVATVPAAGAPTLLSITPTHPGLTGQNILVPEEDGRVAYVFDPRGKLVRTVDSVTGTSLLEVGYSPGGRVQSLTNRDGLVTTVERDASDVATAIVGPYGHRTELHVGADGFLSSATEPTGATWQVAYDHGLVTSFTNPNSHTSVLSYDVDGRLLSDADPGGGSKSFVRTDLEDGWLVTKSTAMGRTTLYKSTFDADGTSHSEITLFDTLVSTTSEDPTRRMFSTSPTGMTEGWQDAPDPRFGLLSPTGELSTHTPGGLTRLLSVQRSATLADPNDPLSVVTETTTVNLNGRAGSSTYDAENDIQVVTSPAGRAVTRTYDAVGHLLQVDAPLVLPVILTYDSNGRMQTAQQGTRQMTWTYGSDGLVASVTNPIGETTSFERDPNGRVTATTRPDLERILVSYDAAGNVTHVLPPGKPTHDFTFDNRELVTAYSPPDPATGGPTPTAYGYNLDQQLTDEDQPGPRNVHVTYDNTGRSTEVTFPTGSVTTAYDTAGRVANLSGPTGETLTFQYDGELVTGSQLVGSVSGTVGYAYDNDFRVTSELVNGGSAVSYAYDADSLLTAAGALTLARDPQNGRPTGASLGEVTESVSYNPYGEVSAYSAAFAGSPLLTYGYTRDDLGRIASKTETVEGVTRTLAYTYDNLGRLTQVTDDGDVVESYAYDLNGNRTSSVNSGGVFAGTFDDQDRMTSYGDVAFTYAANGELAYKIDAAGAGTTGYTYDALGNLRQVALPSGSVIEYVVDAVGRRVGKKINAVLTQGWIWRSALQPVAEVDGAGNVVARFVYADGGNVPAYMIASDGSTYRLLTDHLGSVRLVVDVATGVVAQRMTYDAWGRVLEDTNPGFQPFGFAGGLYDADTGLVRFGARDYDAETGRWTSRDPIGLSGGVNVYGYVDADPINDRDEAGLLPMDGQSTDRHLAARLGVEAQDWADPNFVKGEAYGALTAPVAGLAMFALAVGTEAVAGSIARACSAARGLPTLTKGPGKRMFGEALKHLRALSGRQRVDAFKNFASQITEATNGQWSAKSFDATNAQVFAGEGGEALVFDSAGEMFRGHLSDRAAFSLGDGGSVTVDFSLLKPL
ncbi:MAG: RHS repeat-associated core domain-containing protein [Polyangiaceae bacterium]